MAIKSMFSLAGFDLGAYEPVPSSPIATRNKI